MMRPNWKSGTEAQTACACQATEATARTTPRRL